MSDFSDEQVNAVWLKGRTVDGLDASKYRLDDDGAMMIRGCYGEKGMYGWEIDHIFPKAKLKEMGVNEDRWDIPLNLRPLNAKNNASKGDDYPNYKVTYVYNSQRRVNQEVSVGGAVGKGCQLVLAVLLGIEYT